jgi:hypothetical protein
MLVQGYLLFVGLERQQDGVDNRFCELCQYECSGATNLRRHQTRGEDTCLRRQEEYTRTGVWPVQIYLPKNKNKKIIWVCPTCSKFSCSKADLKRHRLGGRVDRSGKTRSSACDREMLRQQDPYYVFRTSYHDNTHRKREEDALDLAAGTVRARPAPSWATVPAVSRRSGSRSAAAASRPPDHASSSGQAAFASTSSASRPTSRATAASRRAPPGGSGPLQPQPDRVHQQESRGELYFFIPSIFWHVCEPYYMVLILDMYYIYSTNHTVSLSHRYSGMCANHITWS